MIGKKINQLATELAPVSTDLTIIGDPTTGVSKKITLAQLGAIFSGAVSFYTNLAGFPAVGDINVIYCAKDTQKLYLWSGSAYVEVFPSQALLDTYQLRSEKGVSNGYASLDSTGKVPISQLPSSIMEYKGTWNAATNTPTLANGTGDTGDVYICNVAGTVNFGAGPITFAVGDYVIYSGSIWQRSSGAVGTVTSVAASITGNAIGITGSPVTTSGTLAFAFAGTGAQYIKGDGTLATFPSTIAQAERLITEVYNSTGATLTKGTIVYINGGQGNLPTVTKALATGDSTSAQTFGVVQADITNNNNGYVVVAGKLSDLDTQAYTPGTQLYLSSTTAGTWTSTKQYAPAHLVYVGIVVRSHPTQGIVEIKIQNGYELDELHNVAAQTPTNNDGLFWEASTSLWKNKSIATILGYTPQAQLNGTGFVKASGTTITYDNSTYLTTSAAATTYLPLVLSSTTNVVDINGQQFNIYGSGSGFTSGRIIIDPVFSAIGYQNAGVFDGLKILTNGNAEFSNSGVTRFFNQVRFDSTLTNGTYTYTLPGATGTIALTSDLTGGTVTSVGLSSATSGVTIGSTPITTSGTITLAIATASGSQQGLLSSTDWTTFNNKQNALTNPVTGTGTTNYLPKFTGTSTIGNSIIYDDGTNVGVGTTSLGSKFNILTSGLSAIRLTLGSEARVHNINGVNNGRDLSILPFRHFSVQTGNGITEGQIVLNAYEDFIVGTGSSYTQRLIVNNSGNLGLGVTPSAWASGYAVMQYKGGFVGTSASSFMYYGQNAYSDGSFKYVANGQAGIYAQDAGAHIWYQAPSGTAGNAISFTQAMTLNASGNLSIGNTNDSFRLEVTGEGRFYQSATTSSAYLRIENNRARNAAVRLTTTVGDYYIGTGIGADVNQFQIFDGNAGSNRLVIASTGAATFSSDIFARSGTIDSRAFKIYEASAGRGGLYPYNLVTGAGTDYSVGLFSEGELFFASGGSVTKRIVVNNSGNVGIGTTSPDRALTVNGQIGINNDFVSTKGGQVFRIGYEAYTSTGGVNLFTEGAIPLVLGTSSTERMRITSGGNVGIGTSSPDAGLTVETNSGLLNGISIRSTLAFSSSPDVAIAFRTKFNSAGNYSTNGIIVGYKDNATDGNQQGGLQFYTNAGSGIAEKMRITSGGNVGIGTSSPVAKLDLYGGGSDVEMAISTTAGYGYTQLRFGASAFVPANSFGIGNGITGGGIFLRANATGDIRMGGGTTEWMRITSGGLVGIGTTSPGRNLSIESSDIWVSLKRTSNREYLIGQGVSDSFRILDATAGVDRFAIKSTGIVNISNVPTSSAGLSSGDIYKDGSGFLKIV